MVFINIILLLDDKQTAGTLYTWMINRILLVYVFSEKVIDVMNTLKLSIPDNSRLVNPWSILHHIQETYFALFKCLRIMSYSGTSIKRRAKGLGKFVRSNEVSLYEVLFHTFYCYWGKENCLLYQRFWYIEVHYIEIPVYWTLNNQGNCFHSLKKGSTLEASL